MAAISHILTIDLVAERFGEDRDWLFDLACDQMEPEDGLIWIYDTGDKNTIALTDDGIENLAEIIEVVRGQ
jgi:hypothetical protein